MQKVGWIDGYPLDCYDYQSTCGAKKPRLYPISHPTWFKKYPTFNIKRTSNIKTLSKTHPTGSSSVLLCASSHPLCSEFLQTGFQLADLFLTVCVLKAFKSKIPKMRIRCFCKYQVHTKCSWFQPTLLMHISAFSILLLLSSSFPSFLSSSS